MRSLRVPALSAGLFVLAGGLTAQAQNWSTVTGRVKLPAAPEARKIDATTDKEFCTKDGPVVDESLLVGKTGGVQNVVVWLRPDSADRAAKFPADKINPALTGKATERLIDQPCCQFIPRVTAAMAGDKLVVRNSAKVAHNTNMSGGDENPGLVFNINLPPGGVNAPAAPLAAQRTPIPFKCDIHPWMKGYLRVFDHPYFAVTDADGKFTIKDAPEGKWRLVVWHENGFHKGREGVLGTPIDIKGPTHTVDPINLELPKP